MAETVTVRLEADDASDELTIPAALIDLLGEGGEETPEVVGDIAMLGFTQQAHGAVHHSHGEVDERIEEAEALAAELFEERFGQSFAEMTGHDH
jgi:hypothetical protein